MSVSDECSDFYSQWKTKLRHIISLKLDDYIHSYTAGTCVVVWFLLFVNWDHNFAVKAHVYLK